MQDLWDKQTRQALVPTHLPEHKPFSVSSPALTPLQGDVAAGPAWPRPWARPAPSPKPGVQALHTQHQLSSAGPGLSKAFLPALSTAWHWGLSWAQGHPSWEQSQGRLSLHKQFLPPKRFYRFTPQTSGEWILSKPPWNSQSEGETQWAWKGMTKCISAVWQQEVQGRTLLCWCFPHGAELGLGLSCWDRLGRTAQPAPRETPELLTPVSTQTQPFPRVHMLSAARTWLWCSNGNPSIPAHTPDTSTKEGTNISKQSLSHILSHPKLKSKKKAIWLPFATRTSRMLLSLDCRTDRSL